MSQKSDIALYVGICLEAYYFLKGVFYEYRVSCSNNFTF